MEKQSLKELKDKLTEKQKIFCHEYIIDWNGARAARVAGYSEATAKEMASENLTKPNIEQYIELIKNDYEKECGITKLSQLNEFKKIAYSSIAHLHNTWIDLKEFNLLTDEQKSCIESIDTKTEDRYDPIAETSFTVKYIKLKLFSKTQALEAINKMMGYNEPDKIDHSGEIKGNIIKWGDNEINI